MNVAISMLMGMVMGALLHHVWCGTPNRYGQWLGRTCWVRPASRPRWRRCVVTAVSWKGGVCVRETDKLDRDGYWIKKQSVPFRVIFRDPRCEVNDD